LKGTRGVTGKRVNSSSHGCQEAPVDVQHPVVARSHCTSHGGSLVGFGVNSRLSRKMILYDENQRPVSREEEYTGNALIGSRGSSLQCGSPGVGSISLYGEAPPGYCFQASGIQRGRYFTN